MAAPGMPNSQDGPAPVVTRKIAAEAATWIARLHGPDRSPEMEQSVREWLSRSEAHRVAFERCTDVWQEVAGVSVSDAFGGVASRALRAATARERWWARLRWPLLGALALALAAAAYGALRWWDVDVYSTKVGEQQLVVLADGTRMSLNTDTRVRVDIDEKLRSVRVEGGEALFEVAKDASRPFVVRVADSEVVALGTAFSVRLPGRSSEDTASNLEVVLVEGKVTVRPASGTSQSGLAPGRPVVMNPGERMRLVKATGQPGSPGVQQIDRPPIEPMVAWKRGEAVFDDTSLPDAVTEMNRYNQTRIIVLGEATKLRISGRYRTGDSPAFARAVAALHGLELREGAGRLELAAPQ